MDDILVIGEASSCQDLISKINNIFELKHVSKLGVHQDLKFLGHRLVKHHDNPISISLQQDYYLNILKPFNLIMTMFDQLPPLVQNHFASYLKTIFQQKIIDNIDKLLASSSGQASSGLIFNTQPKH